jgi:hypothetical protein
MEDVLLVSVSLGKAIVPVNKVMQVKALFVGAVLFS